MFSFGLYKEGLKRTAFLSSLFLGIMLLGAVFTPISAIHISNVRIEQGWFFEPLVVTGFGDNITLFIAMFAFAPILTLYLFSFLNKRNSCDFYHSIPEKRETIFVSFTASILTWVLGSIWLCTAVTLAVYFFSTAYVIIHMLPILLTALGLSIGCVLVIGATLIAMSVTGSTFSNIIVTLLILFLPRIILTAFISVIVFTTRVVSHESFGIIGNYSYNIPFGFVMSVFNNIINNQTVHIYQVFTPGIFYTTLLGFIYLCIGLILFKKRKSETAQSPALNPFIQATVRITLAFVVCIPAAVAILHMNVRSNFNVRFDDILGIIAIYVIALVVYFAYELITTRKLASIVKALPGLGILVLLNIVFITGVTFTQNTILDRQFEAKEITSVQILSFHEQRFSSSLSYKQHRTREIKIRDEELTTILLENLAWHIAAARLNTRSIYISPITVVFETISGQTIRRNFNLSQNANSRITYILNQNEEYMAAALTLPENPSGLWLNRLDNLPEEAVRDIYETLREEIRGFDLMTWLINFGGSIRQYGELHVVGTIGRRHVYQDTYFITHRTPVTADRLIQHTNTYNFEIMEHILEMALTRDDKLRIFITGYNTPRRYNITDTHLLDQDVVKLLLEAIREQQNTPVNLELIHYSIEISQFMLRPNDMVQSRFFFNSDSEELLEALRSLR